MSPKPQLPGRASRLTKNRPFPRTGVGQKSSAVELTGSPRFTGAPNGESVLARCATQMSRSVRVSPGKRGRFDAMYRSRPSGDWIGQPSTKGVFTSELLPAISSIFCAVPQEDRDGPATAAVAADIIRTATPAMTFALFIAISSLRDRAHRDA